ncbi:hypothetical protein GCM10007082_27320 [Oceanisphaera arctica]|nr:hypothetical protein GCM10007082_27320 [Oceanisphaera arctica]
MGREAAPWKQVFAYYGSMKSGKGHHSADTPYDMTLAVSACCEYSLDIRSG